MFINYLKSAFNNLFKNRLYSIINIVGLSIGLAACLLIILYVQNETSYDKHWAKADRLYRVTTTMDASGNDPRTVPVNSMLLLPAMRQFFPGKIEASSQVLTFGSVTLFIGEKRFEEPVYHAESDFLKMFDLDVVGGDLEHVLEEPGFIGLSTESALRLFGKTDVVGEVLTQRVNNRDENLIVGAVYRPPETNTVFPMPALMKLDPDSIFGGWMGPFASTDLILLKEGVDPSRLEAASAAFTDKYVDISRMEAGPDVKPSDRYGFQLQNIRDIYLHSPFEGNTGSRGSTTSVLAFSAIAVLVLLIGCINFTVLSTSRATQRAREVAMRKTVGAQRSQLVVQFLGESLLLVFLAIGLAFALMELLLPVFEALVGKELNISYSSPAFYIALVSLWLAVSLIGGLYPALVLSWFRPAAILKANRSAATPGSIGLRNTLVVFQFSISIALIIATAVIYAQVQFAMQRDPGFNKENLLVIQGLQSRGRQVFNNREVLKQQVGALPNVTGASLSGHQPMQRYGNSTYKESFTLLESGSSPIPLSMLFVDQDFFPTYEIPVIAGRNFDESRDRDSGLFPVQPLPEQERRGVIMINENAARSLGFTNPQDAIGRRVSVQSYANETHTFSIIGVVADTQFYTLRNEERPEVYFMEKDQEAVLTVRYRGDAGELVSRINEVWTSMMGDTPILVAYVDQLLEHEFSREEVEAQMLISFSLLAIIIACMGLYGSAAFAVDRRTKEIGIRKVMGAEVREIVTLLMWQFSKPVLIANVIAWPVAMWVMLKWLQRFPYQIDTLLLIPLCVMAGFIALSIAWLTVAGNTVKVATTNPVYALRYE